MYEALRELFKDEIEEELQKAENRGAQRATDATIISNIKSLMQKFGMDAKTIMDGMSISVADQRRYLAML